MIACEKCGTEKVVASGYSKTPWSISAWFGSACPVCEPSRAHVSPEPPWFRAAVGRPEPQQSMHQHVQP